MPDEDADFLDAMDIDHGRAWEEIKKPCLKGLLLHVNIRERTRLKQNGIMFQLGCPRSWVRFFFAYHAFTSKRVDCHWLNSLQCVDILTPRDRELTHAPCILQCKRLDHSCFSVVFWVYSWLSAWHSSFTTLILWGRRISPCLFVFAFAGDGNELSPNFIDVLPSKLNQLSLYLCYRCVGFQPFCTNHAAIIFQYPCVLLEKGTQGLCTNSAWFPV